MRNETLDTPAITSVSNPRVKSWLALSKRSERDSTRRFLVEGQRETERLSHITDLHEIIWCDAYAGTDRPTHAVTVSQHVFDRISRRTNPDGVAAVASTPPSGLDQFMPASPELVLVGDGIEKPGNIGAILRTTDALGASFLGSALGTDLVNPNVIRAAQGSLFATPTTSVDRRSAISWCDENTAVVVLRPTDSVSIWTLDLTGPTSIVIGAEHDGVSSEWDDVGVGASIPMVGMADSLNASVSAAIILAEARRQRSAGTFTT